VLAIPPIISIAFFLFYAASGMAIGALTGWLTSLGTRCVPSRIWRDAFLGSAGFMAGFIGTIIMPWHENTVTEQLEGGGTVTTTMAMYQHPVRIAILASIILPLLYELYRFKQSRTNQL
jgi:hypothetical protein